MNSSGSASPPLHNHTWILRFFHLQHLFSVLFFLTQRQSEIFISTNLKSWTAKIWFYWVCHVPAWRNMEGGIIFESAILWTVRQHYQKIFNRDKQLPIFPLPPPHTSPSVMWEVKMFAGHCSPAHGRWGGGSGGGGGGCDGQALRSIAHNGEKEVIPRIADWAHRGKSFSYQHCLDH